MSALDDAKSHLAKAREFLEAADLSANAELYNSAVSNAVTSGINSKDAICLRLTGRTGKSSRHDDAIGELEAAGVGGTNSSSTAHLATLLADLLSDKSAAQYSTTSLTRAQAVGAIERAQGLLDGATSIV